jgi:anaerobic magnesium-protoporphyrin IX monomethyl ester cyclase
VYQLDEIVSPFRERFASEVQEAVASGRWSPMQNLYAEGLLDEVLQGDPELVGICLAFPEQTVEALRLARRIRAARPDVTIALGGPLLGVHPERWVEGEWVFDFVDYLVVGDGAFSIVELVEALEGHRAFESVRNLVHRRAGSVVRNDPTPWLEPLDDLPLPDFDSLDLTRFFTPLPIYPLMLSRGCYWGRCTFCSIGWRENYRMLSRESIERHARQLAGRGARYVQLQDSSIPPRGAHRLAEVVRAEALGLHWEGGFKFSPNLLDAGYCRDLYEGGCRSLKLGLESMNQGVLDLMEKGFEIERVPTMLANLRAAGISAELLWFIGFPTEGFEDVLATVRFLHGHRDQFGLTAFVGDYAMHPDTEVFARPRDFGVTVLGQANGYCSYVVERGLQQSETLELKRILSVHNNRTLVCNGSHLPHLVESGIDLGSLARPAVLPRELALHRPA